MMMEEFYEYTHREDIEKNFICGICRKPFIQPVVISTGERFCLKCVQQSMNKKNELIPLRDVTILHGLEKLSIRCKLCHEGDLERNNYSNHLMKYCPKAIVECSENCPWIGLRDELFQHLQTCSLHQSRTNSTGKYFSNENINFQERHIPSQDIPTAVKALLLHKRLTFLDLFNTKLTSENASIIASVLHHDTHLEILSLRNNFICDSGVQYLAHALVDNSHLQRLDLNENAITDTGVRLLADMLTINQTLMKLTLSFNRITNEGLAFLIDVLINFNSTLQWLSLAGNRGINGLSMEGISHLIGNKQGLQTLILEDCLFSRWQKRRIYFIQKIHFRSAFEIFL